ncbi:MAG: hypothetical protein L3J88_01640 [Gammaproteobacteria bacterium]|nr:hypothetical protein [Gammaproteobacteria bacterium]MCF6362068.1 hypothetical protein [Gammaproteobacteria bacterium]
MPDTTPLLIVAGTLAILLLIQQWLAQVSKRAEAARVIAKTEPSQGKPLLKGLSVMGLDERGISSLRTLMKDTDSVALATFLAFNRPTVQELDNYLQHLFEQFRNAPDAVTAASLSAPPAGMQIDALSTTERNLLLNRNPRQPRHIDRALMARFGGHAFLPHFSLYNSRDSAVTLHVPPFDTHRKLFETLAKSGIASRGRQIPLQQRLSVLKMQELRQMGKDLKLAQKFTRKADATEALSQIPGAAVLLSMHYVIDDLFMLNPLDVDPHAVEQEWAWLMACAKLLGSIPPRRTSLS